jgi:hypothetical protein
LEDSLTEELAMTPTLVDDVEPALWEKRRGQLTGYRKKTICGGQYQTPALYEFSVQTDDRCKKYVIKFVSGTFSLFNFGRFFN